MKNGNINLKSLPGAFVAGLGKLGKYGFAFFLLFLVAIYGFVIYRINTLAAVMPSDTAVTSTTKTPHIDKNLVQQLNQLKDNSVTVQTLFDEARSNPFNE
jgi:hypothetical protein